MLWAKLQQFLKLHAPLAIALSGGLDSSFLAYAAKQSDCDVMLLHARGIHMPAHENIYAKSWASEQSLPSLH